MILSIKPQIERHPNGRLAYFCIWAEVGPLWKTQYTNVRGPDKDGRDWIRIGWHRKYFDNGQLAWQLKYNKFGKLIKNVFISFRKDGTSIAH